MKIEVSLKHIEHTAAIDDRIHAKTKKLEKYFAGNTHVHWVCGVKGKEHLVDLQVQGPAFKYHATASSDNLYKTLDLAVSKLEKQINKKKDKLRNKINKSNLSSPKHQLQDEYYKEEMREWEQIHNDEDVA